MDIRNTLIECNKSTSKTAIAGASTVKGLSNIIGESFDFEKTYHKGDLVIYNDSLHRALTSVSHELPTNGMYEKVNLQIVTHEIEVGQVATMLQPNTTSEYHVNFEHEFMTTPKIFLTMLTGSIATSDMTKITPVVDSITMNGFNIKVHAGDLSSGRAPTIEWFAIAY